MPGRGHCCRLVLVIRARFVAGRQQSAATWLVGDVAAPRWLAKFSSRTHRSIPGPPADAESASATRSHQPNQRKVGKTMLLPAVIFLMILFPVLLPAGITAVDAIARAYRRNSRPAWRLAGSPFQPPPDIWHPPAGAAPTGVAPAGLWGARLQNRGAVPVTGEQREFDVEPVAADVAATPGDGAAHPILHRVEVQVEFLGGDLVAGAASPERPATSPAAARRSRCRLRGPQVRWPPSRGYRPRQSPRRATTDRPGSVAAITVGAGRLATTATLRAVSASRCD